MFKRIKYWYCPVAFLYLCAAIFIFCFANYPHAWNHAVPTVLSRYMPTPSYWTDFKRDRHKLEMRKMKEFARYYQKVSELMPFLPQGHAMAGFCFFYTAQSAKAKRFYQAAIAGDSKVFNFYYNLGLIYLQEGNLSQALEYFKKSVSVPLLANVEHVVVGRIYQPFLPFIHQPQALASAMGEYTKDSYRQAYLQILQICEARGDYPTMLFYARQAIASGILEKKTGCYYVGYAFYQLKEYSNSVMYLQQAIHEGFYYAQAFEIMGVCLKILNRPESKSALSAAASLLKDQKVFKVEELNKNLVVY